MPATSNHHSAAEVMPFPGVPLNQRELVISRVVDAPREKVFAAWTDPRLIAQWWGPHGMTTPQCELDLRPGGAFRTVMRAPDGSEYPTRGIFLEIVPPQRLVFSDALEPGFSPAPESFMTAIVTFEAFGDQTKFTVRALHKSDADRAKHQQMGFYQGWMESFDRLAVCLARLP